MCSPAAGRRKEEWHARLPVRKPTWAGGRPEERLSTIPECSCGAAGALQQEVKASTKEAAQIAITKLSATLSMLLGFCAVSAHAAWLTFALLLKV